MGTLAPVNLVGLALRLVPGPLLRQLDAWSHRQAQRRQLQRQEAWQARKAPAAAPELPVAFVAYKMKHWRD